MLDLPNGFFHQWYHPRELYDETFLDANCDQEQVPVNEENGVDSSLATYATNYVMAVIGIVYAILMSRRKDTECANLFISIYFLCTSLSFGVAGVGHQFSQEKKDLVNQYLIRVVALFGNVGTFSLLRVLILYHREFQGPVGWMWWVLSVSVTLYAVIVALDRPGATGMPGILVVLSALFVHVRQWRKVGGTALVLKTVGLSFLFLGGVFQLLWAPVCGYDAYPDCFRDCPLPAPEFNHNALFHLLAIACYTMYGKGEILLPATECLTILRTAPAEEDRHDQDEAEITPPA